MTTSHSEALPKTIYRVGMETLRNRHEQVEQWAQRAADAASEFGEMVEAFQHADVWQTRFETLLMAVRDEARDNRELQSVANDLCRDIPVDALTFGLHYQS